MKPIVETRTTSSSDMASASFGISSKDTAKVIGMLRDGIYSDKILAVLREYSANAWDAHRSVGKSDVQIEVQIPTREVPTLRIRDFGPGLSHEDVFSTYTQYGASTKENTNDCVGMLGIGSKSGFAYSDSFSISSWHGGTKTVYVAVIDESDIGRISVMHSSECGDETGLEILITVKPEDAREFQETAKKLYQHFVPRPTINVALPPVPEEQTVLKNGSIVSSRNVFGADWIAVMGCVPYRVNLEKLDLSLCSKCLPNLSGSLFFEIGDVQISTSREELKYSSTTKAKLIAKFNDLVDEYVLNALTDLEKPGVSGWDKRLKLQVLTKLDLPLPENYSELATQWAKLTYAPGSFVLLHGGSVTTRLTICNETRILIDDTGKTLANYQLGNDDYVARAEGQDPAAIRKQVEAALKESDLVGCKIELLSDQYYTTPYVKPKKVVNPKHRSKMFALDATRQNHCSPYSNSWSVVERVPEDSDVYVIIEGFLAVSDSQFFTTHREDKAILEYLGMVMPPVYGYKSTDKKPVTTAQGKTYKEWRKELFATIMTPALQEDIQTHFWTTGSHARNRPSKDELKSVVDVLGDTHPISTILTRSRNSAVSGLVGKLADRVGIFYYDSDASKAWEMVQKQYPLLGKDELRNLWYTWNSTQSEDWLEYVKMVDECQAARKALVLNSQSA